MTGLLQTTRLHLRELRDDDGDAAAICALLNSEGFLRYIGDRGVRTPAQGRQYIVDVVHASYRANGFGMYALERRSDGRWLGIAGLVRRDWLPCADLGYALLPAAAGHGYAREAASALLQHARNALAMAQLCAIVDPRNQRSIALLQHIGMQAQGGIVPPDGLQTLALYGCRLD